MIFDHEEDKFYFLANIKDGVLGYYLIQFEAKNPGICQFLTTVRVPLNIDDASMHIFNEFDEKIGVYKELVVGFKTININTYNIMLIDISGGRKKQVLYNHECYQLWESKISGCLLDISSEFVTFSKTGINVVSLSSKHKKYLHNTEGQKIKLHSLESMSYLRFENINLINFKCQDPEN